MVQQPVLLEGLDLVQVGQLGVLVFADEDAAVLLDLLNVVKGEFRELDCLSKFLTLLLALLQELVVLLVFSAPNQPITYFQLFQLFLHSFFFQSQFVDPLEIFFVLRPQILIFGLELTIVNTFCETGLVDKTWLIGRIAGKANFGRVLQIECLDLGILFGDGLDPHLHLGVGLHGEGELLRPQVDPFLYHYI